jgi:hypothetical protein
MRSAILLSLIIGAVSARRNPSPDLSTLTVPSPRLDLGQPYYPFGWGLDDSYFGVPEEFQIHETTPVKKMKPVKRNGTLPCVSSDFGYKPCSRGIEKSAT